MKLAPVKRNIEKNEGNSDFTMPLWLKVALSFLLVAIVIWWMWRLPRRGESYFNWAPALALLSVWMGLIALVVSLGLWVVAWPDPVIAAVFLALDPVALTTGTLVLWIYRHYETTEPTVSNQKLQARVGLTMGFLAVAAGYLFVMTYKEPGSIVGM